MVALVSTKTQKNWKAKVTNPIESDKVVSSQSFNNTIELAEFIREYYGEAVLNFLIQFADLNNPTTLLLDTTTRFNIIKEPGNTFETVVNLRRINDIRYVNKFIETVNLKLPVGGTFIGCVETKNLRKERILNKYPGGINYLAYTFDFMVKRVAPKLPVAKKIYFFLTRGNNRVISHAETLGRLISCGFEIKELKRINGKLFFAGEKVSDPIFPENPTYGMLVRLKRVGKNGKIITVYKFRTMHPFSEYLQDYVYQQNNLEQNGKFKDDFRISTMGKWFRKFWIDELPMLINLLKGDLKLVGVRPISQHYFNLYSEELKQKRVKHKPGLFPPFYADLPGSIEEIIASELRYLEAYEKNPLRTDFRYFRKAFTNIVFKRARSA